MLLCCEFDCCLFMIIAHTHTHTHRGQVFQRFWFKPVNLNINNNNNNNTNTTHGLVIQILSKLSQRKTKQKQQNSYNSEIKLLYVFLREFSPLRRKFLPLSLEVEPGWNKTAITVPNSFIKSISTCSPSVLES